MPNTLVAAAEDVEFLMIRADSFINQHQRMGFMMRRSEEAYAALVGEYVSAAVRLATKQP